MKAAKRSAIYLAAAAAFLLICAASPFEVVFPARARAEELPDSITLDATQVEHLLDEGLVTAAGDVHLAGNSVDLWTDSLTLNLNSHLAQTEEPVKVKFQGRELTGKGLTYDWQSGQGTLTGLKTNAQGLILDGAAGQFGSAGYHVDEAGITRCDLPVPEYKFTARSIDVDTKTDRLTAKGARLWLFGHSIIPVPDMQFSLSDTRIGKMSRESLPVPQVGYSSSKGYFASDNFSYLLSADTLAVLGVEYGSKERLAASARISHQLAPWAMATINAQYTELGLNRPNEWDGGATLESTGGGANGKLTWNVTHDDNDKDLKFWPEVSLSQKLDLGVGSVTPSVDWASITEDYTGVSAERGEAKLNWSAMPIPIGRAQLTFSGVLRYDDYSGYGTRKVAGASATLSRQLTPALSGSLARQYTGVWGDTPFSFDDISADNDVVAGLGLNHDGTNASVFASYNLDSQSMDLVSGSASLQLGAKWRAGASYEYDMYAKEWNTLNVSLTRELHCFALTLSYDEVDKTTSFSAHLK